MTTSPASSVGPFVRRLLAGAVVFVALAAFAGCSKSPADRLVDESLSHLEAAATMLEEHAGKTQELVVAVMHYRVAHHEDFKRLRSEGERLLGEMGDVERRDFYGRHRQRAAALSGRLEALAKRYDDQRLVMRTIRPLMIVASPRAAKSAGGDPPWLPPVPPPPTPPADGATATAP
ncbi:MAG: hypothetical protein H6747_09215 [Deltaproteobacteria bacterium]|nr:hypothetical protein [Deltaproteobacteria bacterium]